MADISLRPDSARHNLAPLWGTSADPLQSRLKNVLALLRGLRVDNARDLALSVELSDIEEQVEDCLTLCGGPLS